MPVALTVNGQRRELAADPETPLLYALRNDLGLKAARYGCGAGLCGSCMVLVLVDGKPVPSCDVPVSALEGKSIVTLEGLEFEKLREAFIEEQAAQCAYCSSGILVAAAALLHANPHPGEAEIRTALKGNLCRCGAHGRVIRAVQRASR